MGRPNYSFAKRQREIAKKKKKEEKRLKKAEAENDGSKDNELVLTQIDEFGNPIEVVEEEVEEDSDEESDEDPSL